MPFIGLSPFFLLLFSLSLLFYRQALWGWGLRTDRVLIALSQPDLKVFMAKIDDFGSVICNEAACPPLRKYDADNITGPSNGGRQVP